ncbi:MAG: hypothetical protein WA624_11130 [Methylocella sp.]
MGNAPHRRTYARVNGCYPSGMTDGEGTRLAPLIPRPNPEGGRAGPTRDQYAGGDQRHCLSAAQSYGTRSGKNLHMDLREDMEREASPTAAIIVSPSLKGAEKEAVMTA